MDKGNSLAANAACAIQRLRILPFTTGSALLQLQTDPHDRWKMECAFKLCTIHLPRSGGATSPGQMQRTVTRSLGLLVWPEVSSPDIADSASPPRFHPRYGLARKPRKSPSTLSAFAMLGESLAELGKAQCFFTFCQTVKILFVFFIHTECLFG